MGNGTEISLSLPKENRNGFALLCFGFADEKSGSCMRIAYSNCSTYTWFNGKSKKKIAEIANDMQFARYTIACVLAHCYYYCVVISAVSITAVNKRAIVELRRNGCSEPSFAKLHLPAIRWKIKLEKYKPQENIQ